MSLRRLSPLAAVLAAALIPSAAQAANPVPPVAPNCYQPTSPSMRRVCSPAELAAVLKSDYKGQVVIPRDVSWEMKEHDLPLKSGVSVVGERGSLGSRPTLYANDRTSEYSIFLVKDANDVRVEGLHLRGPEAGERNANKLPFYEFGVTVVQNPENQTGRNVVVTDMELDEWPGAGVSVAGTVQIDEPSPSYTGPRMRPSDAGTVRIERSYLHNNARDGGGYGVVVGGSAYATIEGNVFNYNRHDISADFRAYKGYIARFNYVLEGGFQYGDNGYFGQHFDVHGAGTAASRAQGHYDGGPAGEYFQVAFNTIRGEQDYGGFLGFGQSTRAAFELRGRPSIGAEFTDNFLVHDDTDEAIRLKSGEDKSLDTDRPSTFNLTNRRNQFDVDYTREIAAGDFDGDRRTDVFVANGTGWFFSRGGVRPWEMLHESTKRTKDLAFADIDNDGKTDVLYRDGAGRLGYLAGGTVDLRPLTTLPVPISELRFGDFDGDRKTDMFYTRNQQWYVWYGKTRTWTPTNSSVTPVGEMLFGEFDNVRGTDLAAVRNGQWSISSGTTSSWQKLNNKLSNSFSSAVAADFNGNGKTDIALTSSATTWTVSYDGRGPLTTLRKGAITLPLKSLLTGHFDGGTRDQVVGFDNPGLNLAIWRGASSSPFVRLSSQPMR
jgi:hypothetical protein